MCVLRHSEAGVGSQGSDGIQQDEQQEDDSAYATHTLDGAIIQGRPEDFRKFGTAKLLNVIRIFQRRLLRKILLARHTHQCSVNSLNINA